MVQNVEIEDNVILDLVLLPFCPPFISRPLDAVGVLAGSVGEEIFDNFVELEGSGNTIRNSGTPGTSALTLLGGGFDCGKGFGNVVHASWHDNTVENYDSVAQVFGSFFANGGSAFLSLDENVGKSLTASGVLVIGGVGDPPGAPPAECNLAPGDFFGTGADGTADVESEDNVFRAAAGLLPFVSPVTLLGGSGLGNFAALSIDDDAFRDFPAGPFVLDTFFVFQPNTVVYEQEDIDFINTPNTVTVIQQDPNSTVTVNVEPDDDDN